MNSSVSQEERVEEEETLHAIKELTRYLQSVEKELSSMSKRMRRKEIAQSVGFVGSGIHEALQYLAIVKKVIGKTQRLLDKRTRSPNRQLGEPIMRNDEK